MKRIKNLDKIKEIIKSKLPEYLRELGGRIEGNKLSCPHTEAHTHGDTEKLSAAFLPQSQNSLIYCFVEDKVFDIFDIYALKTGHVLTGQSFYDVVKTLADKYKIPYEEEYEFSIQEQERRRKRRILETIHSISIQHAKEGVELYKLRNINKEKLLHWKIGYLTPELIPQSLNKEFKSGYDYSLLAVFTHPALVIPILDENQQYSGLVIRQFGACKGDEYLNISMSGKNLFNLHNVRGSESLTIVEGTFDAMALYPEKNVVGCLTNTLHDTDLEKIAKIKPKKITMALDPDNLYQGLSRDGFLKALLKMKNVDAEIEIVVIPAEGDSKPDPDEFMRTHTLEEFHKLPHLTAIQYLLRNHEKKIITAENIYDFIAGCPNLIRKEHFITECAQSLNIGKRQLTHCIEGISENKSSFNLIQYAQERDALSDLLESFTESAWNKNFNGVSSGFTLFDKKFGGFEDTLYLLVGFPETGKCHTKGTKILMYDGSQKNVEDVQVGDNVMGEHSNKARVESTCTGRQELFNIVPNKGESFGVNKEHILVLSYNQLNQKTNKRETITLEMPVKEFLTKSVCFQKRCKLIRKSVEFKSQDVKYDPYLIGLWLGDGTRNQPNITSPELELEKYFVNVATLNGLKYAKHMYKNHCATHTFTNNWKHGSNPLLNEFRLCVKDNEKRIPSNYLINSTNNRLSLLAGLLDSDGYLSDNTFNIICKDKGLRDDILFLVGSLGLGVTHKIKTVKYVYKSKTENRDYFSINIFGDIDSIPTKLKRKQATKRVGNKDALRTGFSIVPLGIGQYYGFTLDAESKGRYLLGDFTLTHNSTFLLNFIYNLAQKKDTFVAFYSLDDGAKRSVLPRLLSIASGLTSKQIKQPAPEIKDVWFTALKSLESFKDSLVIKDGSDIRTLDDLENYVKIHAAMADEKRKKLIVVIDNLHDIVASHKFEAVQNSQRVASFLKRLPQQINCPIIATAEVPKSSDAKPSGKDIKESIDLWYAARFVGGIFSNFHQVKNKNQTNLIWQDERGEYQPIMELFVSKNQTGEASHGSLYYKFSLVTNRLVECTESETETLKNGQFLTWNEEE